MPLPRLRLFAKKEAGAAPAMPATAANDADVLTPEEREFLPHLLEIIETPPSPLQRRVLWAILAMLAALLLWACFGKISIVSTVQGKFIPDGRVKQVQPLETSVVTAIHVREGQHVRRGDVLLELDPTLSAADLATGSRQLELNRLEQARLAAELGSRSPQYGTARGSAEARLQENLRRSRDAAYAAEVAAAEAEVAARDNAWAAARATQRKLEEVAVIARQREADARPLVESGAIARIDYLQLKQELAAAENDLVSQVKLVQQAGEARTQAARTLDGLRHGHAAELYTDLGKRVGEAASLQGSVEKSQRLHALKWLRAPVDGWVQKVEVATAGGVVTPAQPLVTIVPDGTPLVVEAALSNADVGYVRVGQEVEIKVDTFPFQKYGTLKGRLTWISPDAEEKKADGAVAVSDAPAQGYTYKVYIRPEKTAFLVAGRAAPIQAGMTLQADIVTDQRRIIEFFLAPIIKYLDEGLTVR
jgi:hemolysin D